MPSRSIHVAQMTEFPSFVWLNNNPLYINDMFSLFICQWSFELITHLACCEHVGAIQSLSCVWLCNHMDCSPPGFLVHHQLLELTQTHVHRVGDAIQPSHPSAPTIHVVPFSCRQSFLASGSFPMSQFFTSGGQSIGVSASASVLPMNIPDWFPLGWTGWTSLQSKGLSRVFSNTTVQKHRFFSTQLYSPTLPSIHDYWKNLSY